MSEYRDYGQSIMPGASSGIGLTGVAVDSGRKSQVYQATYKGNQRLPYMYRSFISFTFGGKHIEDFNLIATIDGDRMERNGYADFEDRITENSVLNGQQYWGTRHKANNLKLQLSTDGMTQRELDDFLYWFRAGDTKELILAEHPNRAILARLASPPELSLLPFETTANIVLSNYTYSTKTTLYKGEIKIEFVMDEPYWYSKENILGKKEGDRYINIWKDANGQEVNIFASQDALKILLEDGIPLGSMIQNNMLLGNGAYASVENNTVSLIWSIAKDEDITWDEYGVPSGYGARINGIVTPQNIEENGYDAETNPTGIRSPADLNNPYVGTIAGAIIDATGDGIRSLSRATNPDNPDEPNVGYFYYSGTAPAPTIITFTLVPQLENNYIVVPFNSHTTQKYNTLTIESISKQELHFTTPNILTSFNKIMEIFGTYVNSNYSWEDVRAALRDEIRHKYAREWAIKIVDTMVKNNRSIDNSLNEMKTAMSYFLRDKVINSNQYYPMTFMFNSETGEAIGTFTYREITNIDVETIDQTNDLDWASYGNILEDQKEDVGDMLRSNYLIIRDRNYPTKDRGNIVRWQVDHKEQSHRIYHDVPVPLTNLSILYKNMYL